VVSPAKSTITKRWNDPAMLLGPMRERLQMLLERLRADGHSPVVFETLRSKERAAMLAKRGTGIALSMHVYGCAADLICARHRWSCAKHKCGFYDALGKHAEALGLVWGGRFKNRDFPHVQCVPIKLQNAVRNAPSTEAVEIAVRAFLERAE
jgi:peptidoglycan L-alanyl-D-glutamate endopeptidase CwlK